MSELQVTDSDILAVHDAFAQTRYGQALASRVRFERYKPAQVTNEQWVDLLGADVNNLEHMVLTYGLTKQLIKQTEEAVPGSIAPNEQILLKVGAITHDQAEAIIGDITYSEKTSDDESAERHTFRQYAEAFSPGIAPEFRELVMEAQDKIVFDRSTKLGAMFSAVESIGYVRTALRASEVTYDADVATADGCRWLVADVLGDQVGFLTQEASKYPPVMQYLNAKLNEITDAYHVVFPRDFRHYTEDVRREKYDSFQLAKKHWLSWANRQRLAARELAV